MTRFVVLGTKAIGWAGCWGPTFFTSRTTPMISKVASCGDPGVRHERFYFELLSQGVLVAKKVLSQALVDYRDIFCGLEVLGWTTITIR